MQFFACRSFLPVRGRKDVIKSLVIMKLTAIFLFAICFNATASSYAQTINLNEKDVFLDKVFKEIRRQTGYTFVYTDALLKKAGRVTIKIRQGSIDQVLNMCFQNQRLSYTILNKMVIIKERAENHEQVGVPALQPTYPIYGKVTSQNGEPLAAVTVHEKGSDNMVVTKEDGSFIINVSNTSAVLVITSVGYASKEIAVNNRTTVDITLIQANARLTEIVITGYSSERKKDITGSVAVVDMRALKTIPTGTAEQALQGQASGVTVISSGAPGGRSDILVRGVSSFGNNQPLTIIDGVQGSLHDINVNDIESVQVLKDAGAASIYGVRGSNGVLVVTTKKGKTGKIAITYDAYGGEQVPLKGNVFNLLNSQEYASLVKRLNPGTALFPSGLPDYMYAGSNASGIGNTGDPAVDPSKYNFDALHPANDYLIQKVNKQGTDWFGEIFKRAPIQSHNLSAAGGTDKAKYFFSLGAFDQKGTLINTYLKRYSARVNTQFNFSKNIRLGENLYLFYKSNPGFVNLNSFNAVAFSYRTLPVIPVYDIMGNYGGSFAGPELGNGQNPVAIQQRTRNNKSHVWDIVGNAYVELDILKNLTARTSFGGTLDNQYNLNFAPNAYNDKEGHTGANSLTENSLYNNSWTWTNTLNYKNNFDKHSVRVLIGSEAIRNNGRGVTGSSNGFFATNASYLILGNGTTNIMATSTAYDNTLYSLFSRLDYSFNDKYLLSSTIRRDGSSQFGANKRYGVFPSFSAGWRISEESFMKKVTFINDLKIRGSWGKLGSQNNIRPNNAYTLFSSNPMYSFYDINGLSTNPVQGFYRSDNGNPNTGWEEDIITNAGLDVTLLDHSLDISVEWYKKEINGLLFPQPLPYTAGSAAPPYINIGNIQNKGWDISANYRGKVAGDLQYNVGVNLTTYRNTVVDIPGEYFDVVSSELGPLVRNQVGHPVGSFFGYAVERLFSSADDVSKSPSQEGAAPGRFKYKDIVHAGKITTDDRTFIGNPNPDFTYGINISLSYKGFDLATTFYGSHGNDVFNHVRYFTDFYSTLAGNKSKDLLYNSWTPQHLNAKTPIAEFGNSFSTAGVPNSYFIEDGSFLKCRSMLLAYTINSKTLEKFGINRFRVYLQAANLFMITKYKGLDPEITGSLTDSQAGSSFGVDFGNYPNNQKSFMLGVNLSF